MGTAWSAGVDLIYAEGDHLQRNLDDNAQVARRDEFGRPIYSDDPINPTSTPSSCAARTASRSSRR